MSKKITPYKDSTLGKKQQIAKMFDAISNEYDGLNRIISFGIDIKWRNKVVQIVADAQPINILDIATGTGDLAINLTRTNASQIIGLDISEGMLDVGRQKILKKELHETIDMVVGDSENLPFDDNAFDAITVAFGVRNFENLEIEKGMLDVGRQKILKKELHKTIDMVVGDSENLPFDDNAFDAITVAFGVRNFENLEICLAEILRVLKPGGIVVVLETSVPTKFPFKQGYYLHTRVVLPLIGKLFSNDKSAYSYLSESASKFPYGTAFNNILTKTGFINTKALPQTFGVATIYTATKH